MVKEQKCAQCGEDAYFEDIKFPHRGEVFCSRECQADRLIALQEAHVFCTYCNAAVSQYPNHIELDIHLIFCDSECLEKYAEKTDQEEK